MSQVVEEAEEESKRILHETNEFLHSVAVSGGLIDSKRIPPTAPTGVLLSSRVETKVEEVSTQTTEAAPLQDEPEQKGVEQGESTEKQSVSETTEGPPGQELTADECPPVSAEPPPKPKRLASTENDSELAIGGSPERTE